MVLLEVSLGEALDKLSILEIKLEKIKDQEKLKHVQKEYDTILNQIDKNNIYYNQLKQKNLEIWDLMDKLMNQNLDKELDDNEYNLICRKTVLENDNRFKIKNKINENSNLKEQKSYK